MTRFKWLLSVLLILPIVARAQTVPAASCNTSDVKAAINMATEGETVTIPAGICSWTSGVTISGKGIAIQGAGSGRIIAYDNGAENLAVAKGTLTVAIAGYSPGFSESSITTGETLTVFQKNFRTNWMRGTVTSLSGSTLTMNITSTGGNGSGPQWLVSTIPSTVLINNAGATTMFKITEDPGFNTNLSGFQVAAGTGTGYVVSLSYVPGGQAILIHDCWMQHVSNETINSGTNRGVIWNCSFDGSSENNGQLDTGAVIRIKIDAPAAGQISWTQPSYWGTLDTTGQNNLYFETNDVHAFQGTTDNDDNGRLVLRYNLLDTAGFATHGADTSNYGQRYFEYYNNTGVFYDESANGHVTMNMANGWIGIVRGGTFVVHDNTLPELVSQDYGTKQDVLMIVMNLRRAGNPYDPCWGANFTVGGEYYHAPRQVGMGRVTGTGTANFPPDGVNNSSTDGTTYVGDSEPAYIWNNSRVPLTNVGVEDYAPGQVGSCTGGTYDSSANYIVLNRDYFNGSTAKPGYTPYTYPHPLTTGTATSSTPAAPTSLTVVVN